MSQGDNIVLQSFSHGMIISIVGITAETVLYSKKLLKYLNILS